MLACLSTPTVSCLVGGSRSLCRALCEPICKVTAANKIHPGFSGSCSLARGTSIEASQFVSAAGASALRGARPAALFFVVPIVDLDFSLSLPQA